MTHRLKTLFVSLAFSAAGLIPTGCDRPPVDPNPTGSGTSGAPGAAESATALPSGAPVACPIVKEERGAVIVPSNSVPDGESEPPEPGRAYSADGAEVRGWIVAEGNASRLEKKVIRADTMLVVDLVPSPSGKLIVKRNIRAEFAVLNGGLTFDVYNAANVRIKAAVGVSAGDHSDWYETPAVELKKNRWTTLTADPNAKTWKSESTGWKPGGSIKARAPLQSIALVVYSGVAAGKLFIGHIDARVTPPLDKGITVSGDIADGNRKNRKSRVPEASNADDGRIPPGPLGDGNALEASWTEWRIDLESGAAGRIEKVVRTGVGGRENRMLSITGETPGKAVYVKRELALTADPDGVAKLAVYNPSRQAESFSVAFQVGEAFTWVEAPVVNLKPGWNVIIIPFSAKNFKTKASGWKYTAAFPDPAFLQSVYLIVHDSPKGGADRVIVDVFTINIVPEHTPMPPEPMPNGAPK